MGIGSRLGDRGKFRDLLELMKSGITMMVVVSTAVGMLLASRNPLPWTLWFHALLGTGLVSAGALALNQFMERHLDARMERTANRPLPAGRLKPWFALVLGIQLSLVGIALLAFFVNPLTAILGGLTTVGYLFLYTPLKRFSHLSTIVGAIPGAIPPLMGWTAVTNRLETGGWILFAILFIWQLPHFLSIAWIYREDYARGGFPMLPVLDPGGRQTARQAVLWCASLIPVSLLPTAVGLAGLPYFIGAFILGSVFLLAAIQFAFHRDDRHAKKLLIASVIYEPLILITLVLDRIF